MATNPQTQHTIDRYVAVMPEAHWAAIESFVRSTVTTLAPNTRAVARNYLAAAAKFSYWVWQTTGADLNANEVYRPELVRRFLQQQMSGHSATYRYQTAQRLNVLVQLFSGAPTRRQTGQTAHTVSVYRERDLIDFYNSAEVRSTPARRANARVLLGLGTGAGLRAEEIARTQVRDISFDIAGATVTVTGKHARAVPVRSEWVHSLRLGVDGANPDDWAFTGYRLPEYPARIVHQFGIDDPTAATPSATRLRATWIVGLLNSPIPVNVVLHLAGLATATSLNPFVRAMGDADPMEYLHLIRGGEEQA
jgi:integrase